MTNKQTMKSLVLLAALASTAAMAQTDGAPAAGPARGPADSGMKFDFTPLIQEVDSNKDGRISLAEWKAAGICESIQQMLDADKDGSLSIAELTATSPQAEADQNKDGKLSASEMIWVCNAGPK